MSRKGMGGGGSILREFKKNERREREQIGIIEE